MTEVNIGSLRGSANLYVTGDADPFRLREKPLHSNAHCMWGVWEWGDCLSGLCALGPKKKNLNIFNCQF